MRIGEEKKSAECRRHITADSKMPAIAFTQRIYGKAKGRGGVTFAETLAALLIIALAVGMLATASTAAGRSIQTARQMRDDMEAALEIYVTEMGDNSAADTEDVALAGTSGSDAAFTIKGKLNTHEMTVGEKSYEMYDFSR